MTSFCFRYFRCSDDWYYMEFIVMVLARDEDKLYYYYNSRTNANFYRMRAASLARVSANHHAGCIQSTFLYDYNNTLYGLWVGARKSLHSIFSGIYLLHPTLWNITMSVGHVRRTTAILCAKCECIHIGSNKKKNPLIVSKPARALHPSAISGVRASRPNRGFVDVE